MKTLRLAAIVMSALACTRAADETQARAEAEATQGRPLKTLKAAVAKAADGGTIYLKASKGYSANGLGGGLKRNYWTVITAAPGVNRDDVELEPGRPGTDKLCFRKAR